MRLDSFLDASVARTPDKMALVFGDRRLTYGEIDGASDRLAAAFRAIGVRRGDRVVIYMETCPEAVIAIFAALRADGVFMPLSSSTKEDKLRALVADARASVIVTDARRLPAATAVAFGSSSVKAVFASGASKRAATSTPVMALDAILSDQSAPPPPRPSGIDIDLAALIYTSGSSGRPKGVMLTHRNITSASTSIISYLRNEPSDIILNVLPLSFDYGLYQVLMSFQFGGTVVLERSFTYMHPVLETLVRERVTGFPVVPTIAALLLQMDLSRYDFSSLRYITNTGAALPVAHIAQLRKQIPNATLYSMYGLTECKRVSYLPPPELDRRPGSVGRGMPNQELYLVDGNGARLQSGVGELVVRGSHVMQGYWERPEETAAALMPGRYPGESVLRTGDLFRMDDEGFLYFISRTDDIIKTKGEKVSPREVADVLHRLDGIAEAVVTGVPDPILGQLIKARVVVKAGVSLSAQDVFRHCAQFLEDGMVPHVVEFCAELPRNANGKHDLAALAASDPTVPVTH